MLSDNELFEEANYILKEDGRVEDIVELVKSERKDAFREVGVWMEKNNLAQEVMPLIRELIKEAGGEQEWLEDTDWFMLSESVYHHVLDSLKAGKECW